MQDSYNHSANAADVMVSLFLEIPISLERDVSLASYKGVLSGRLPRGYLQSLHTEWHVLDIDESRFHRKVHRVFVANASASFELVTHVGAKQPPRNSHVGSCLLWFDLHEVDTQVLDDCINILRREVSFQGIH